MFSVHIEGTDEEISRHPTAQAAIEAAIGSHVSLAGERIIRNSAGMQQGRINGVGDLTLGPRLQAAMGWR